MAVGGVGGGPSMEWERPNSPSNVTNARNNAMIQQANQVRQSQGLAPVNVNSSAAQNAAFQFRVNQIAGSGPTSAPRPAAPRLVSTGGSSGGSRSSGRRSSGGGGGGGTPKMTQAQLDWAAQVLKGGGPQSITANTLDLPDYQGMNIAPFDPSMYQQALAALNQGQQTDLATANQATQNMLNFLNTNYTNAFNNPNQTYATAGQAPGYTQQAMQRMLQSQGADPNLGAGTYQQAAGADQAFGNLWRTLAANEDIAQRGRIGNANLYGAQANDAINAAASGGRLGVNLGQAQAQQAWAQRDEERRYQDYQQQQALAQQEALQNWQRGNTVQDENLTNTNQYRNAEMQALLGLLPQLVGTKLTMPSLASLGLG